MFVCSFVKYQWILMLFTHRRNIAKRGGCFQRRLFVCQCVYPHDNFTTTKHRTIKVGDCMQCIKISIEFEGQGQRSEVKVSRD